MKKLFLIFLLLALVKILLSLPFESPWVFGDAAIYTAKTRAILQGNFQFDEYHYGGPKVPPLYSLFLVPAYLFDNPTINYHLLLIINALLSSFIVIPAFFITRRFVKANAALLIALLISVYPSIWGFSFMEMSENLFFPLFLASAWLLLKTFEKKSFAYESLLGLSLGSLALTRVTGIFPIAIYILIVIFQFFRASERVSFLFRKFIALLFIFLPLYWWFSIQGGAAGLESRGGYKITDYFGALQSILTLKEAFVKAFSLGLSQLGFILVTSFIIAIPLGFFGAFRRIFKQRRQQKFRLLFAFTVLNAVFFLGSSVAHQFIFSQKDPVRYLVFGRYVEPVIPLIILLGAVVLFRISRNIRFRTRFFLLAAVFLLAIFSNAILPSSEYDLVNNISLLAFRPQKIDALTLHTFLWLFFLAMTSIVFLFPKKSYKRILVSGMIILSLLSFIPLYSRELALSRDWAEKLDAYHWIAERAEKGEIIGFDSDKLWEENFIHLFWLYEFWSGKQYHEKLLPESEFQSVRYLLSGRDITEVNPSFSKVFQGEYLAVFERTL